MIAYRRPRAWQRSPRITPLCALADGRRRRNAKTSRRRTAAHPAIHRCQQPHTQIHRKRLSHPCWPPSPAQIMDQNSRGRGIPPRSRTVEKRSSPTNWRCFAKSCSTSGNQLRPCFRTMACRRFGGHRDRMFPPIGGPQCNEGSSAASSSSRP